MKTSNIQELAAKIAATFTLAGFIAFSYYVVFIWAGNIN